MSQTLGYNSPIERMIEFTQQAPVDLNGMAHAMGLRVRESLFLPSDVLGKIERDGETYRITINGHHTPRRKRFTLAHEIAHYILHRSQIGDGITDAGMYRSRLSDDTERQANNLAAAMLMPAPLMERAYANGTRSIDDMAELFRVSKESASIRMRALGLMNSDRFA